MTRTTVYASQSANLPIETAGTWWCHSANARKAAGKATALVELNFPGRLTTIFRGRTTARRPPNLSLYLNTNNIIIIIVIGSSSIPGLYLLHIT